MWLRTIFWDLFGRGSDAKIEAFFAVGYLLGRAALVWCWLDLQRLHRVTAADGDKRKQWQLAAVVAYLAGGWPVFLLAVGWRTSSLRADLVHERARLRSRLTV